MRWMIYGAGGYTGELVARTAVARGECPVLGGRDITTFGDLADELGLTTRTGAVATVDLADLDAVAHCAGPFTATGEAMLERCIDNGTDYVDICGEIGVLEALFAKHGRAEEVGIVAIPAVGFDAVPSDCLAAKVNEHLGDVEHLEVAFAGLTRITGGTLKTWVEAIGRGGVIRQGGHLVAVRAAWRTRNVPFPSGPKKVATIPMADVSTAHRSVQAPNIVTYAQLPIAASLVRGQRLIAPMFRSPAVADAVSRAAGRLVRGPQPGARARLGVEVWVEGRSADGRLATAAMRGPEGYAHTADIVVSGMQRLAAGGIAPGVHAPSTALGPDFVDQLRDVTVIPPSRGAHESPE